MKLAALMERMLSDPSVHPNAHGLSVDCRCEGCKWYRRAEALLGEQTE